MNRTVILLTFLIGTAVAQGQQRFDPRKNLCFNPTFDDTEEPLHGWMIDYQWTKNRFYQQNHKRVSLLATYKGRKNVMSINGSGGETKVESKP
ncbi:MAG: hypothetical protein AAF492_05520, partial [Verrucomicrobiota bacterium]